ncbi:tRNA (adenosine(37)-N6)-dimethylallyltransferase MiaA [Paenibacillus athensensis]|uniref:tRNA dimethylallyltransferase n=1 Tax=Paenibacillus athensensis TaxID=1967502 RepID=A0A4Y8Q7G1_9BACL|nr:tRNA (adenosine(37)-N6)-dimethylallyltransferase MiaA [Paenibacillus athensensis]MCD1257348.1 tRNA (adenosine(37)-N6)-dimethylallyltransferase MiaA [Paenibacillus athensensis]
MLEAKTKPPLLVLVGPTAVGKTRLSLEIARRFGCEIISGDSMQVYRGMDIGTAKASVEERELTPHHLIDIHDPRHPFSVAEFQERVRALIVEISSRGKLPFIVGGTGLYVESVCYNFQFTDVGSDPAFRQEQESYAERFGADALHQRLREVDPESAGRLHPNDIRRVVRALEVFHLSGTTLSASLAAQTKTSPYNLCLLGLTMERSLLYKRIEERIDQMLAAGLIDEVRRLLADGVPRDATSMQGLGYKEMASYLQDELTFEEAVILLKRDTRHFAKRQLSWFRHMADIHWTDVTDPAKFSAQFEGIHDIIAGKFAREMEYNQPQSP